MEVVFRERSGSSPLLDNDSSKSHRDSSEIDMDTYPDVTKIGHYSEEGEFWIYNWLLIKRYFDLTFLKSSIGAGVREGLLTSCIYFYLTGHQKVY